MRLGVPYVLVGIGLPGGLAVLSLEPLPGLANTLVAGALLGIALGSIVFLIVRGAGPDERGPEF